VRGAWQSERREARGRASGTREGSFSGGWRARRVELNRARGSQSGKFAAQDSANARARQTFSRAARFPAPAGGARVLSRAANGRLFYRAGVFAPLLEMLLPPGRIQ
jgi:hypothetical protein